MSHGGKSNNQHNSDQKGGGNVTGKGPSYRAHPVPSFQGKSGQSDNQDTNRKNGK